MKIAIMQPYIFPYIGYFQLVNAVDRFVFYDDVNFIKGGWIHRNRIAINSEPSFFTVPLQKKSSFIPINEIKINEELYDKWRDKFLRTLDINYKKAPFFNDAYALIETILNKTNDSLSDLAIDGIRLTSDYLNINKSFEKSSLNFAETMGLQKADRLIQISKLSGATIYVNPSGGKALYSEKYFNEKQITLKFIENGLDTYERFNNTSILGLSIIDILMFCDKNQINKMLNNYVIS